MDCQLHEQVDRWIGRQMDRWIGRQLDKQVDRWKGRQMDRQINGQEDRWIGRQMDTDGQIDRFAQDIIAIFKKVDEEILQEKNTELT